MNPFRGRAWLRPFAVVAWALAAALAVIIAIALNSGSRGLRSAGAQATASPDPAPPVRGEAERGRIEHLLGVLRAQWDSKVITGQMVDEMRRALEFGGSETIEPLLRRLELLESAGEAYKEDFALWWNQRGRIEVLGSSAWNREGLRSEIERLFEVSNPSELDTMSFMAFVRAQGKRGDPVALLWAAHMSLDDVAELASLLGAGRSLNDLAEEVEKLADSGDPDAALTLGLLASEGVLMTPGRTESDVFAWLETAAEDGSLLAMMRLVKAYDSVRQNEKGFEWLRRAAEAQDVGAMEQLSRRYIQGRGVARNREQAKLWSDRALGAGSEVAAPSRISRVRSDQRALATALESYYIDNNAYPAATRDLEISIDSWIASGYPGADFSRPTFRRKLDANDRLMTLTTPVAYLTSYFTDPFAEPFGRTFRYVNYGRRSWLVWSAGPDGDYDLDGSEHVEGLSAPTRLLLLKTYDPTNGVTSSGDLWRMKQ